MEGYILHLQPDDKDTDTAYVTETGTTTNNIDDAFLFEEISSARIQAGKIQSEYTTHSVQVLPAIKGISLKTSNNVAASTTDESSSTL